MQESVSVAPSTRTLKNPEWVKKTFEDNPRLHRLLSEKVKGRLLRSETDLSKPFANDLDYLEDVEVALLLRKCEISLEELLISQELNFEKESKVAKDECLGYIGVLEELRINFEAATEEKLKAHVPYVPSTEKIEGDAPPLLPRIIRIAQKLDLVDKEKRALNFIIISVVGQEFGKGSNIMTPYPMRGFRGASRRYYSFESLLRYSGMTISEGITFLRPSRVHLTQGLFSVDKVNPMLNDYLEMPHETVAVLTGTELTATELLKIDKTKLHEVVDEEVNYAERTGKADKVSALVSLSASSDSVKPSMEEQDGLPLAPLVVSAAGHAWNTLAPPGGASPQPSPRSVDSASSTLEGGEKGIEQVGEKLTHDGAEGASSPALPTLSGKGDVFDFLRQQRAIERTVTGLGKDIEVKKEKPILTDFMADESDVIRLDDEDEVKKITPYKTDIEYLDDQIKWITTKLKVSQLVKQIQMSSSSMFGYGYSGESQHETQLRELRAKERMLKAKCQRRLDLTRQTDWLPRLERLALAVGLDDFEKIILLTLVAGVISQDVFNLNFDALTGMRSAGFTVGGLLSLYCKGFEGEVRARPYFYKAGTLVREGIIRLSERWGDLMGVKVELDRRMLDFIVGLDTEFTEMVEGSHSYFPKVDLLQVILPEDAKRLIVDTVEGFESYKKFRKELGFEEIISYGNGVLLMFFGPSGTGKTMMANALGNHMGKKILLINYTSLGGDQADEVIKFIFREAKLTDSILFFDECEQIFLSREKGGRDVNLLLTEIERHDGLIIMATNRAFDLDEAMHRRITLAIEFRQPDPILRQRIWKAHIPKNMKVEENIDWKTLALKYELSGGFIKNAVLSALSAAVNRDRDNPIITQADLEQGSKLQLRGRLKMIDFDRRVVPTRGIEDFIGPEQLVKQLQEIVNFEKARQVLFGQWGYSEKMCNDQGTTALFYGHPGVGKTLAAEVVGFETGKPLKVINCAELVSKYVGETGKNIEVIFKEAKTLDCILVFDEAESLFGARSSSQNTSTDRYANMDTGILLYHMEKFPGIVILTTNLMPNIDSAFYRRLRFMVDFPLPDAKLREKLWKMHLPPNAPLAEDVDLAKLASQFPFAGGNIKNVCFKAAARAALRIDNLRITMDDLMDCAKMELEKGGDKLKETHLYS